MCSQHSDKTARFMWDYRLVTDLFRLSSRVFVFSYKRMTNGRLLGPTCWKPVKKRSGAFRAPRKFRTFRGKRSTQSTAEGAASRRFLLDITASRLFIAVKIMHVIKSDKISSHSRLMTRRFDLESTGEWMRRAVHKFIKARANKIKQSLKILHKSIFDNLNWLTIF